MVFIMANEINTRQKDLKILDIAIQRGLLSEDSNLGALTNRIKQEIINGFLLERAIFFSYLPFGARVEDLDRNIKYKLLTDGVVKRLPDCYLGLHLDPWLVISFEEEFYF